MLCILHKGNDLKAVIVYFEPVFISCLWTGEPLLMEPVRKGFSMVTELLVQYGAKVDVESTVRREGGRE